jgi:hypothetical protein
MKRILSLLVAAALVLAPTPARAQRIIPVPRFVSTQGRMSLHWPLYGASAIPYTGAPGTLSTTWGLGGTLGPLLNVSGSALEARNAANSAYAVFRTANPVGSNDAVNLGYLTSTGVATGGDLSGNSSSATVLAIRGVSVPSLSNGCLTSTGGVLSWGSCGGGGGTSVTGTGLWYSASGTLNGAAVGLSGDGSIGALSGGNLPLTLSTVNSNVGSFGSATLIPTVTVNAKGLVTSVTTTTVTAPLGSATGILAPANGGFGVASPTAHGVLVGEGSSAVNSVVLGDAQVLVGQTSANPAAKTLSQDLSLLDTGAATVTGLQTEPVQSGAPTTGNALVWSGSQWTHSAVNLAGGSSSVTGLLPTANQTAQTMTGDDVGTTSSNTVTGITGSGGVVSMHAHEFTFDQGDAPLFNQAAQANTSNPSNFTISPQAPGASASTTSTGTPASLVLALSSPVSTGSEAALEITRAGVGRVWLGPVNTAPTYGAVYLGTNTGQSTYALASNGTTTIVGSSGTNVQLYASGNPFAAVADNGTVGGVQVGYPGTNNFGGGRNVLSISPVLTTPTSGCAPSTCLYTTSGGALELDADAFQFTNLATSGVTITQNQASGSNSGAIFAIQAQNGGPSGATSGGTFLLLGGAPSGGGTEGSVVMETGSGDATVGVSSSGVSATSGSSTTEKIAYTASGTINTQDAQIDREVCYGKVSTNGVTILTCTSPTPITTGHSATITCRGLMRATSGSGAISTGDSFEQTSRILVKDVSGTVSQVGATSLDKVFDSSYASSSAISWNNNSTVLGCAMFAIATSGATSSQILDGTIWLEVDYH